MGEVGSGFAGFDEGRVGPSWHWLHPRPGEVVDWLVVSSEPLWFTGHFQAGRMMVCNTNLCSMCALGVGKQRRWVLVGIDRKSKEVQAWEFGDSVAEKVRAWAEKYGSCIGLNLEIRRAGDSVHSKLLVECMEVRKVSESLVSRVPTVMEVFTLTFGLTSNTP